MQDKLKNQFDIISKVVAEHHGVQPEYLFRDTRLRAVVDLRAMFFYFASRHTNASLNKIGSYSIIMGRETPHNHATVLYQIKKTKSLMYIDRKFRENVEEIENKLRFYVDYEQLKKDEIQEHRDSIVNLIYSEQDIDFLSALHDITKSIYEDRVLLKTFKGLALIKKHQRDNEGIHKTTQKDTGLGVVQGQ